MKRENSKTLSCPISGSNKVETILQIRDIPLLCNVLYDSKPEAVAAKKGDINLGFCMDSGHLYNLAFDPGLISYAQNYNNSLHFSPRFQKYASSLARHLVDTYNIRNKNVLEIGCGNGDFLNLMHGAGNNYGIGFDPSYQPDVAVVENNSNIRVHQKLFSGNHKSYDIDLVVCRHVLEHVEEPLKFIQSIRQSLGEESKSVVYFEVPNVLYTINNLAIWDLIYEHFSYFSPGSLRYLFSRCGFEVLSVKERFGGQYLGIEAIPNEMDAHDSELSETHALEKNIQDFKRRYKEKVDKWQKIFEKISNTGQRAVIWGAGSKGVTILNWLSVDEPVEYVVDINPGKQGKFIAGTGQQVVDPEFLNQYRPEVVIIMNKLYREEIENTMHELGQDPEYITA